MNDKKTPIPLRASRKQAEPITFPRPVVSYGSNTTPVDANLNPIDTPLYAGGIDMRDYIHQEITKALYAIGNYDPEPNIATMTYDEFEAFMVQVWEDE